MLKTCKAHLSEEYYCPHCQGRLTCCNVPPFHVGDGLGWGSEYMYICLDDECPLFVNGWKHVEEQYGHSSSYRYMLLPGETKGTPMMVGSPDAFKGCEVDIEALKSTNKRYATAKEAAAQLETCVAEKNLQPILTLILDDAAQIENREKACDLLGEMNDLSCIDPIRNHTFLNEGFAHRVNLEIFQLLKKNFRKECPFCAEIIKAQAKICQHCNRDL